MDNRLAATISRDVKVSADVFRAAGTLVQHILVHEPLQLLQWFIHKQKMNLTTLKSGPNVTVVASFSSLAKRSGATSEVAISVDLDIWRSRHAWIQVGAIRIPESAVPWLNSPCKRNTGGETVIVCGPPGSATLSDSDDDLASLPDAPLLEPPPVTDLNNNFWETVIVCGPPGSVTLSIYHPFQVLPCWSLPIRRIPTITLDISSGPPA